MKNEIVLKFGIWGFTDITHTDITKSMGLNPSKVYIKGERKNPKFPALAKENGWVLEPACDQYSSFETQLKKLLQIIESRIDIVKSYSLKYTCEISCVVYIYFENGESIPSIHLSSDYNNIIRELNLEFDIDIYCLPK